MILIPNCPQCGRPLWPSKLMSGWWYCGEGCGKIMTPSQIAERWIHERHPELREKADTPEEVQAKETGRGEVEPGDQAD